MPLSLVDSILLHLCAISQLSYHFSPCPIQMDYDLVIYSMASHRQMMRASSDFHFQWHFAWVTVYDLYENRCSDRHQSRQALPCTLWMKWPEGVSIRWPQGPYSNLTKVGSALTSETPCAKSPLYAHRPLIGIGFVIKSNANHTLHTLEQQAFSVSFVLFSVSTFPICTHNPICNYVTFAGEKPKQKKILSSSKYPLGTKTWLKFLLLSLFWFVVCFFISVDQIWFIRTTFSQYFFLRICTDCLIFVRLNATRVKYI